MKISKGVGFMLLATFLFTLMNVFVKLVSAIPAIEIIFFRSLISLLISFAFLKSQGVSVFGNNKKLLLLRGFVGAVALIMIFTTIQNIPLASAVTLQFLAPIFTTILGVFLVKEKVKPLQFVFFGLAFAGILLVKGFDARVSVYYLLLGVGGALFSGLAYNIIRKLNISEHPLVIIFYFPLVTLPITLWWVVTEWVQPQGIEWVYLLVIGLLTQAAQYFMTRSYQMEELNKVASLNYISIVYALGLGYLVFGEAFNTLTYLGMVLVLAGVILNVQYKRKLTKEELKRKEEN